jgi:hypothetical protein
MTRTFAGILVLAVNTACSAGSDGGCIKTWESSVPSPDGRWRAIVHEDVCDGGLVRARQELVDLVSAANPKSSQTVLTPRGQWDRPDEVTIRWLSPQVVEVSVPNRTVFDTQLTSFMGVSVQIHFENNDPADRAKWMQAMADSVDEMHRRLKN